MRRTEANGGLKIVGHTHGEALKAALLGELGKEGEVNGGFFIDGRDAHQP